MTDRRLLTAEEVAEMLGIARRTVWRLAASGQLRAVRVGTRAIRFDPVDVEAFIATRKETAA